MRVARAIGRVDQKPIPRLLIGLRAGELTGRLEIEEPDGKRSVVYLRRGRPVHVDRSDALDRLDQVLVQARLVPESAMAQASRMQAETGRLLGEILRELGYVAPERLVEALRLQMRRKVTRLFFPESGTYQVMAEDHRFGREEGTPGVAIETRPIIYPGIRATHDEERLTRALTPLAGTVVRLTPGADPALREAGFSDADPLLAQLDQNGVLIDPQWLRSSTGAGPREAKAALLALHYLDLLEVQAPGPSPVIVELAEPTPAPVRVSAPARNVPDLSKIDPAQLLRVGEAAYRKGDLAFAEEAFAAVVAGNPKDLKAQAFLTRIRAWKTGLPSITAAGDALNVFRTALNFDANFGFGLQFIGEALRVRGDGPGAERAFRAALRLDPTLLESAREVRLADMRRRK